MELDNILFDYGEACEFIYFIMSGIIVIELINKKEEVVQQIDTLGRGSIIGQNYILNGSHFFYRARVVSAQSLRIVKVQRAQIKKLTQ